MLVLLNEHRWALWGASPRLSMLGVLLVLVVGVEAQGVVGEVGLEQI